MSNSEIGKQLPVVEAIQMEACSREVGPHLVLPVAEMSF